MNKLIILVLILSSSALGKSILLQKIFSDKEEIRLEKTDKQDVSEDDCESGCAAYDDGYSWAEYNQPKSEDECSQGSEYFDKGCYDWFDDHN